MAIDLDALEAIALAAEADWSSNVPTMPLRRFHEATYPPVVLALISELRKARAAGKVDQDNKKEG